MIEIEKVIINSINYCDQQTKHYQDLLETLRINAGLFKSDNYDFVKHNEYTEKIRKYEVMKQVCEKQVGKRPERLTVEEPVKIGNITFKKGTSIYKCPDCGTLIARHYVYCNNCGQKIDYGDEQ